MSPAVSLVLTPRAEPWKAALYPPPPTLWVWCAGASWQSLGLGGACGAEPWPPHASEAGLVLGLWGEAVVGWHDGITPLWGEPGCCYSFHPGAPQLPRWVETAPPGLGQERQGCRACQHVPSPDSTLPGVRAFVLGSQRVTEASLISLIITTVPPIHTCYVCPFTVILPVFTQESFPKPQNSKENAVFPFHR